MNKQRLGLLILSLIGILCTFLPWATVMGIKNINGTEGDGWITLALFLVIAILTLTGDRKVSIKGGSIYGVIVPAGLNFLLGLYKIVDLNTSKTFGLIKVGYGLYLLTFVSIAIVIIAFVLKDKNVNSSEK